MLDFSHIPSQYPGANIQVFTGTDQASNNAWQTWIKPRGKTMCHILTIGGGGKGGQGQIGANSVALGGAGGSSGGQVISKIPLWAIPDVLYISVCAPSQTPAVTASVISTVPSAALSATILSYAFPGNNGGTVGAAGAVASTSTNMPLGWQWAVSSLAGQNASTGGTVGGTAGGTLALPTTGLLVTAGTGGGSLGAAGAVGLAGGPITGAGEFATILGGVGSTGATIPPGFGGSATNPLPYLLSFRGGTGSGSTHGSATGAGLVQSPGGVGQYGCGGGGTGAALTGSSVGEQGLGGPGLVIITCW